MGTPLDDRDLAAEIALLGEVLAAISTVGHELTDPEVDVLLGVTPTPGPTSTHTPGKTPVARL